MAASPESFLYSTFLLPKKKDLMERLITLSKEIVEAVRMKDLGTINMEQCSRLSLMAASIQEYLDFWTCLILCDEDEEALGRVVEELFIVLTRGLQLINLCNGKDAFVFLGSTGQFREIITDAILYIGMIEKFIYRMNIFAEDNYFGVELEWASSQDKDTFIGILKSQPGHSRSVLSILETRSYSEIEENELYLEEQPRGHGSFGKITVGKWRDVPVAVKEFFFDDHFADELEVFQKLLDAGSSSSPHVVQMFGYTKKKKLVLELMDTDLKDIITVPRPLFHSVDIIHQIAQGMMYLHENNVVHRDLKPGNVLVTFRNGQSPLIKVTDFGISKGSFESAMSNTLRGTLFYMAPEMTEGTKYSRKVDVYSFGLVCKEILAGKLRQTWKEELLLPQDTPGELASLIRSCLQNDANNRPDFETICHKLWLVKDRILSEGARILKWYDDLILREKLNVILRLDLKCLPCRPFEEYDWILNGALQVQKSGLVNLTRTHLEDLILSEDGQGKFIYLEISRAECIPEVYSSAQTRNTFADSVTDLLHPHTIFNAIVIPAGENVDNLVAVLHRIRENVDINLVAISCSGIPGETWPIERAASFAHEIHIVPSENTLSSELVDKYVQRGVPPAKIYIDRLDRGNILFNEVKHIAKNNLGGVVINYPHKQLIRKAFS